MASVQIHNPSAFNITNFLNNMGQVIETANSAKTDQETYEEKKHTAVNGISEQLKVHATSMELIDDVETLYSDKRITVDETVMPANGPYENSNQSNTRQAEEIIESNMSYENEEYLCTGETLDEKLTVPSSNNLDVDSRKDENDEQGEKELQHSMDWSEKKRQFSLMKYQYSESSLSSEVSSASRHSFSLYLQAREYDAEEVLVGLGFGFEGPTDIPVRFLNSNSYNIISSQTDSTNSYGLLQRVESERPELDEVSSRTSFESSWSNSSMDRLPSRFSSSISRLSSVSSLISEPDDNENQSVIPSILEPEKEKEHDDGFDLMRHLRLNRGNHEKGFLEPVTEELEVSSVGSDSARTKVSAPQQDSFDSVGNVSIVTKILVQKEDSPVDLRHQKESELTASLTKVNTYNDSSNESLIESTKEVVIVQSSVQEASVDNLHLPSLNNSFASRYTQESFELEEIATSEENLDKIEENTSTMNIRPRNRLKRDHSDDSSGFEDDGGDTSKKSSPEAFDTLKENQSEASHSKQHNTHLLVPVEVSTPKNESSIRRSTFAKRRSWSATKQKRVVFEDEASLKSRSFEDFRADATLSKGDFRSRSLDIPLPLSNRLSDASREVQDKGSSASNSFDIPAARSVSASDEARTEYSALVVKDERQSDSTDDKDTLTQNKPFSESSAIRNIKYFMSNLLSIRSKLKKNPIPSMTEKLLDLPKSTETEVCNLEQPSIGADDVSDLRSSLRETSDQGQQIRAMPSITVTSCQKASHYELSTFEEDIQKYRSTFIAMEVISTAQDRYYTRKLQARFAWDILFIRRLRSHIMEELDELRSNLCYARGLPLGAQSQMHSLLRLQSGLRENLLTLAGSTTDMTLKSPEPKNALQSLSVQRSVEDIETKIRESVVQEISSMFEVKINELRDEMKAKDSLIEKLLKRLPEMETS